MWYCFLPIIYSLYFINRSQNSRFPASLRLKKPVYLNEIGKLTKASPIVLYTASVDHYCQFAFCIDILSHFHFSSIIHVLRKQKFKAYHFLLIIVSHDGPSVVLFKAQYEKTVYGMLMGNRVWNQPGDNSCDVYMATIGISTPSSLDKSTNEDA